MDRQRNTRLQALLIEFDFTHKTLADEVNTVSEDILGKPGDCTDRHVRRWISGEVRWPWTKHLLPLEQIFDRPAQGMGFIPRGKKSANLPTPPSRPSPASKETEPVQHRRRFLTASAAATVALALGIDETPARGRLSISDMERVYSTIGRLDAHFFAIGGGPLLTVCTAYIDRLRTALDGCAYGDRVERALHGAISNLYASAGWAAHDGSDSDRAALLHTASLRSALLAGDPSATARAWSNLALQARIEGRHREAVQITRAALDNRRARQNPHISALLHARLAIGQAKTSDRTGAARSLLAAEQAYDRVDTGVTAPTWLAFLSAGELSGLAAITHQALGLYDRAEASTAQALELLPPSMRRSRAYYGVQLAELQLAQGEREQAADTVTRIDHSCLDSRRISGRLATVQRTLTA
ncbi:twin-arginine translocation signal domain-containing protein (plasmid) [Streptomyces sp. NBC_01213]|uniref:twin-arginine translocation signal domain-containing protein n=1 Tax=Streptomyces sp. NBC_01213 TaxID=2903776 RepID=UPI002F90ACB5|nr:twin-arginine translocation signal domain-containing protein [Streptomyces sp. NBC_01213]